MFGPDKDANNVGQTQYVMKTLGELLPMSFGPQDLPVEGGLGVAMEGEIGTEDPGLGGDVWRAGAESPRSTHT